MDALETALHRVLEEESIVGVLGCHVNVLVDRVERDIGHAQLLSLIEERRATLQDVAGCQHGAGRPPVAETSVAADDAGMIMVLQIEREPGLALQAVLPSAERPLELAQPESVVNVFGHEAVREHGVELDQHIQHAVLPAYIG